MKSTESNQAATVNTDVLDKLYALMKENKIVAKVGILGSHATRKDGTSNAVIGAAHEYGSPARNIPMRSFLRMPITENLPKEIAKSGMFTEDMFKEVMKENSLKPYVKKLARAAEAVIAAAFDSNGFGKWKPLNEYYAKEKDKKGYPAQILVATTQLRDSITSEVK